MAESRWDEIDLRARQAKRATVAQTKRGVKIAEERVRNAGAAAVNLARKAWRRAVAVPERARQRFRRLERSRKILDTYRAEWAIEREIGRTVAGDFTDAGIDAQCLEGIGHQRGDHCRVALARQDQRLARLQRPVQHRTDAVDRPRRQREAHAGMHGDRLVVEERLDHVIDGLYAEEASDRTGG